MNINFISIDDFEENYIMPKFELTTATALNDDIEKQLSPIEFLFANFKKDKKVENADK